jgi:phage terminase large subunit
MDLETKFLDALDPAQILAKAGFPPDAWQAHVLRSPHKRILMNCSRQTGKSLVAAAAALHEALWKPRALVLLVSPSLRQSNELFRRVADLLRILGGEQMQSVQTESLSKLELTNGSRILSLPGQDDSTIRGYSSVDLLCMDEAARVDDRIFAAVKPTLAVSGGRTIALSTPNGKRGWFYREWVGEGDWLRIQVTADQCPRITPEFLEEEKRSLGEAFFTQEYMCEFVDTEFDIFDMKLIQGALVDMPELEL